MCAVAFLLCVDYYVITVASQTLVSDGALGKRYAATGNRRTYK